METELESAIRSAWAAHERLDWADAIHHWETCARLDPTLPAPYWMGGSLMLHLGRLDEAEAMLSEGVRLDPSNLSLAVKHAQAATALKDWPEAIRRWNSLVHRAPEAEEVLQGLADFAMHIQAYKIDKNLGEDGFGIDWSRLGAFARPSRDVELFMQFESLGDNCEFGLVQRHFGAEPLSLLRWNSISISELIVGIQEGFRSAGDMQRTQLVVRQQDEYVLLDHSYGMAMHTFIKASQTDASDKDTMHGKMCQRQAYLVTKLRETLEDASKVFVFKATDGTSLDNIVKLYETLQRYGRNRLLHVVEGNTDREAGSVEEVTPGLFVAAIDRFGHDDRWDTLSFAGWHDICRKVAAWGSPEMISRQPATTLTEPAPAQALPLVSEILPLSSSKEVLKPLPQATAWDVLTATHPTKAAVYRTRSWWQRAAYRMLAGFR